MIRLRDWLSLPLGLLTLRFLPELPSAWIIGLGFCIALLLWPYVRPFALFLLGLGWACVQGHWALEQRLPASHDGRTFWLEGQVVGLPEYSESVVRFDLDSVTSRHIGIPARIRVSWYKGPKVQAGERWRLAVTLKQARGSINPGGFDYEAWALARGLGAVGTVKAGQLVQGAESSLGGWRDQLRTRLLSIEAAGRAGGLAALVVGDGSGLSRADWQVLQDTGTVHLMVISGQHVSLLAAVLFAGVALLFRWGIWPQTLPWLPVAVGLALFGALGYGWLAGFEVPVQRACLMVALALIWRLCFWHLGVWLPLLVSVTLVLVINPLVSLQAGFWLSFAAVALLILGFSGRLGRWTALVSLWRAQWLIAVGLLPLLLALSLPVSLTGPIANLVAVPWVSILVVPLALLGSALLWIPPLADPLLGLAGYLLEGLFQLLRVLATWQSAWQAPELSWGVRLLLILGALLMVLPAGLPVRTLGLVLWLPLFFPPTTAPAAGRAEVWVLDVGQGLSVLIRTAQHSLLYDTGPRWGDLDMGERLVLPSLRALGVQRLDRLILSHEDNDHAGGLLSIVQTMPVLEVMSGTQGALAQGLGAKDCQTGSTWEWDQVRFSLWRWEQARDDNQSSCVLSVEASGERLLLTGDIDQRAERAWLTSDGAGQADWLLLGHHGSRTSSSAAFLKAVRPQAALVSRGWGNSFGHPHPEVVQRLESLGISLFDTAKLGALRLELGARSSLEGLRVRQRFWFRL